MKRAIGKLDKEDWNIKNIEEKMEKSKKNEGKFTLILHYFIPWFMNILLYGQKLEE